MKITAFYKTFNGGEFLVSSVNSIVDQVDNIVIYDSQVSWAGNGVNNCTRLAKKLAAKYDKVEYVRFDCINQMTQYKSGLRYINEKYKPDWILYIDSDEIWTEKQMLCVIGRLPEVKKDAIKSQVYTYLKSVFYRVDPIEELEPVVFVRGGLEDYGKEIRSCDMDAEIWKDIYFHHYSYVREDFSEILTKLLNSHYSEGQRMEDLEYWLTEKWAKIKTARDLHPAVGFQHCWKSVKKISFNDIPYYLTHPLYPIVKQDYKNMELNIPPSLLSENDVRLLFDYTRGCDLVVDLGTYKGGSAAVMAFWAQEVITVDCYGNYRNTEVDYNYRETKANLEKCRNVKMINAQSWDATEGVSDNSVDLIFVDACHEYEEILKDFKTWYPKLKRKGLFLFHDYDDEHPNVKRALKDIERWNNGIIYEPLSNKYIGTSIKLLRKVFN